MTYCVGMTLNRGLIFMSDTRTNAGVDNISTFRKMTLWDVPGRMSLTLLSSGNLATTQAVISQLEERSKAHDERDPDILSAPSMFQAAQIVADTLRDVVSKHANGGMTSSASFKATLILGVITGGGSALMAAPAARVSLADLQATTDALLASGATIDEINAVRKHCSAIKGGRLAAATQPAAVCSLVISDVVGNDRATIASGPLVGDPTTYADARGVLNRYDCDVPAAVIDYLGRGAAGEIDETPAPGDPVFASVQTTIIGNGRTAVEAAADRASEAGFDPLVLSSQIRGEAREAAKTQVAVAEEIQASSQPIAPPAVVVSGGETTVTVDGDGTGGPNQEFALSAAVELAAAADSNAGGAATDTVVAAVDTDGIDGPTDAAGGIVDSETIAPGIGRNALAANDATAALDAANARIETGPTGTNVNDLRVVVVGGS